MKNLTFIIFAVLVAGVLVFGIVYYKQQADKLVKTIETERYSRLVAEEKAVNSVSRIKQLESDLKENQDKIAKIQSLLKEEKNVNKDLETQFERLSKAKAQLEDQLKTVISQPLPVVQEAPAPAPSN